jgi:hypothetical protein
MYRYSLIYLALLFVAMGVDRAVPFGHREPTPEILILDPSPTTLTPPVTTPPTAH